MSMPSSVGKMTVTIEIHAEVSFTIDDKGTEVNKIDAEAKIVGGIIAIEPPIAMSDAGVSKLKLILADAVLQSTSKQSRERLSKDGLAPMIEIINEKIGGNKNHVH